MVRPLKSRGEIRWLVEGGAGGTRRGPRAGEFSREPSELKTSIINITSPRTAKHSRSCFPFEEIKRNDSTEGHRESALRGQ